MSYEFDDDDCYYYWADDDDPPPPSPEEEMQEKAKNDAFWGRYDPPEGFIGAIYQDAYYGRDKR